MKCRDIDRLIDAFLDGDLSPVESRGLEMHADSCVRCRNQLREWRALSIGARQLPRVSAPAGFEAELMRRIRFGEREKWRHIFFGLPRPAVRAIACASLALAVGLSVFLLRGYFYSGESAESMDARLQRFGQPAATLPIAVAGQSGAAPGGLEESAWLREQEQPSLIAFPAPAGLGNYAIPKNVEYVDYLLKGTGDREVYVRLPKTFIYYPPADNDLYYVRNISH